MRTTTNPAPPAVDPDRPDLTPAARKVLETASRLFYERGIHAVGVDLIAAESGVTKKTLYDRFGSKEQIVVDYLATRDARWRAYLAGHHEDAELSPTERVLAVFDASQEWMRANSGKGCSMVNAHAEISDPAHPAYAVITGQKRWMLELFTRLAGDVAPDSARELGRSLMLLHEGALVADGLDVFPDAFGRARRMAAFLLSAAKDAR
ncbi:TetR/AcrR family transcriptional regulator [Streptomyces sp. NBC_01016]|uniref:TetR/AcrR family transcriptional regulator n=1 Tax=Streptomyces sp. NBC_01016 TaxID=2903720 RepID=UPI0022552106|nr:TetR/AcrR family transcriptional regulator [Streptomyces sp. NBC_01016]MCX4832113.1 TetR/AcrR family transcriptional regulator [Streptomyces sp. NBC_01016]